MPGAERTRRAAGAGTAGTRGVAVTAAVPEKAEAASTAGEAGAAEAAEPSRRRGESREILPQDREQDVSARFREKYIYEKESAPNGKSISRERFSVRRRFVLHSLDIVSHDLTRWEPTIGRR